MLLFCSMVFCIKCFFHYFLYLNQIIIFLSSYKGSLVIVMEKLALQEVDQIAQSCLDLYNKLPKSGKPIENEWTVLSCIVQRDKYSKQHIVVSLGTGSKCIGATKMSPTGDVLNDSHAEVFARRGFLLYLYDNIDKAIKKQPSIFDYEHNSFKLKENIQFIFYSSQLPCGDASIIPKNETYQELGDILESNKRRVEDSCDIILKKPKLIEDIHRTGAKCLPNSDQDPKAPGLDYHIVGQVRTKPGRGDRTLSVSCSDKLAKWIHMGIQGSLLSLFCTPIYINHFIFGGGVPYSEDSLMRALLYRNSDSTTILNTSVVFYQSNLIFDHVRSETRCKPAAGSIVWIKTNNILSEVAIQGKKLGVTKKNTNLLKNSLCISKYKIYNTFIRLLSKNDALKQRVCNQEDLSTIPYNKMKLKLNDYYEKWKLLKEKFFKIWTVKPDMWDFCISLE